MSSSISSEPILLSYCHGFGTGIALHCREIQRTTMKKALKIHFQPPLNEAKCVFEYRSLYQALIREGNGRFYQNEISRREKKNLLERRGSQSVNLLHFRSGAK